MESIPGLEDPFALLLSAIRQQRLPQSLLLGGEAGLGKRLLAEALAARLLCEALDKDTLRPCGVCASCHLLASDSHPDFLLLEPLEAGKVINIEQVREASEFLQLRPQHAPRRVLLLAPAEAMPPAAANAFLKTLEEPGPHGNILLVSHALGRLLPTIRSRCSQIRLVPPDAGQLSAWLQAQSNLDARTAADLARYSLGRPLRSLEWIEQDILRLRREWLDAWLKLPRQSPAAALSLAAQWAREKALSNLLLTVHTVVIDILRLRLGASSPIINDDFGEPLSRLASRVAIHPLIDFETQWRQIHVARDRNLNLTLVLESLGLAWRDPALWSGAAFQQPEEM